MWYVCYETISDDMKTVEGSQIYIPSVMYIFMINCLLATLQIRMQGCYQNKDWTARTGLGDFSLLFLNSHYPKWI